MENNSESLKKTNRILILGANGMLGKYVSKTYLQFGKQNVIGITREDFDFNQSSEIVYKYLFNLVQSNDLIINCIGMTNKRENRNAEQELQFWRINAVLPRLLGQITNDKSAYLVHITTDCVFDGKEPWMCRLDAHTSIDLYGITKSMGDKSLAPYKRAALIRCSIIGEESNNRSLVEWVLNQPEGSEIDGYTNHMWNGITCLSLAICIFQQKYEFGIENIIASDRAISKYELVCDIVNTYGMKVKVNKFVAKENVHRQLSPTLLINLPMSSQIETMKQFDVLNRRC